MNPYKTQNTTLQLHPSIITILFSITSSNNPLQTKIFFFPEHLIHVLKFRTTSAVDLAVDHLYIYKRWLY